MLDKFFSEIFLSYCSDTQQRPERELALNLKQLLDKNCTDEKFILKSQRIGIATANSLARYFAQTVSKDNPLHILDLHENVIRDKGVQALIEELKALNTVKILDLGSNDLGSESAILIADYLKKPDCKVESLILGSSDSDLYANKIEAEGGVSIAEALSSNFVLHTLDFNRNSQLGRKTQQAFFALADAFDENKTISCLRLGQTNMGPIAAVNVIQSLEGNSNLRYLDIHGNDLPVDIAESLGKLTCSCKNLSVLLLQNNCLRQTGTELLCSFLKQNTFLTVLNLAGNEIGNEGAQHVSDYLSCKHTLVYLNLSKNQITEEGIINIAQAINCPQNTLHSLNLSNNRVGNSGAKAIAKCIEYDQCGIVNLELNSCGIGDQGAVSLCLSLTCNTTMLYIKIHNNHISEEAGRAVLDLLEKNHTLMSFDVRGNQLDHPTYLKIKKVLQRNKNDKMLIEPNKLKKEVIRLKYVQKLLHDASKELEYQENIRLETTSKVERINERIKVITEETDSSATDIITQIKEEQKRIDFFQERITAVMEDKKQKDLKYNSMMKIKMENQQKELDAKAEIEEELKDAREMLSDTKKRKEIEIKTLQEKIKSVKFAAQEEEKKREKHSMEVVDIRVRLHDIETEFLKKFGDDQQDKIDQLYMEMKKEDEETFVRLGSKTNLLVDMEALKKVKNIQNQQTGTHSSTGSTSGKTSGNSGKETPHSSSSGSTTPTRPITPKDPSSGKDTPKTPTPKDAKDTSSKTGRSSTIAATGRKKSPPSSVRRNASTTPSTPPPLDPKTPPPSNQPNNAQNQGKMRVTNLSIYDSALSNK